MRAGEGCSSGTRRGLCRGQAALFLLAGGSLLNQSPTTWVGFSLAVGINLLKCNTINTSRKLQQYVSSVQLVETVTYNMGWRHNDLAIGINLYRCDTMNTSRKLQQYITPMACVNLTTRPVKQPRSVIEQKCRNYACEVHFGLQRRGV